MAIIGGEATSPFPAQNALYNGTERMQAFKQNELLQQSKQQEIGATDQEMVARASAYIDGLPADQKPTAYASAVRDLQSRGFAMKAPAEYPGDETIKRLATMGTPSKDTLAIGASQAAKSALYPGQGASAAPAGGGGMAPAGNIEMPAQQRARLVYDGLIKRGMDADTATAFAANALHESAGNPNTGTGDGGASHGLFMWNGPRLQAYVAKYGHTPDNAPLDEQLDFVTHELAGSEAPAGARISQAQGAADKAAEVSRAYLRPKDTIPEMDRRSATATQLAGLWGSSGQTASAAPGPGGGVAGRIPGAFNVAGQTAAPSPAAAPARLQNGLTPEQDRQMQVLRTTRGVTSEDLLAAQERFRASNRAEDTAARTVAEQTYQHGRETQADQLAAQRAQREQAKFDQEQVQAGRPYPGNSPDAADNNILLKKDQSTPEAQTAYANAYARQRTKNTESGITFYRDMSMFDAPKLAPKLDAGNTGQTGGRDYGQVQTQLAPNAPSAGDQSTLRQIKTEGSGILNALEEYRKTANEAGGWEKAATALGVPTSLATTYTNAILLSKGKALFELGVLNGKDLEVLQRALADPTTIRGGLAVGPETRNKQIDDIVGIVKQKIEAATTNYGGGAPKPGAPVGGVAPASPASTPPPPPGFKVIQ